MSDKKYTSIHRDDAAGRIEFDGGKAVWQWSQDQNDSTSILIKSLDNPEIELEKTQRTPIAPGRAKTADRAEPAKTRAEAAAEKTKTPKTAKAEEADEDDTLWQLRKIRGGGFDPYNRG